MGMIDVHGALAKEEDSGWEKVMVSKWEWSMAKGFLNRRKILAGRVRVSKWGWSRATGLVKRNKTLAEKEEDSGWESQSV